MKFFASDVVCTAIKEPRSYEFNGKTGTNYAVEISDGSGSIEVPVVSKEVFEVFEVFERFNIEIVLTAQAQNTANGARVFPRVKIVGVENA